MDDGRKGRRRLSVDLDTLLMAVDNNSYEITHYLDLDTGEVVPILRETQDEWERSWPSWNPAKRFLTSTRSRKKRRFRIGQWRPSGRRFGVENEYGSRYIPVPPARSSEGYEDMAHFTETVHDELVQSGLIQALQGKKPFRRFKDTLLDFSKERERWFQFKLARPTVRAFDWLESLGITPIVDDSPEG